LNPQAGIKARVPSGSQFDHALRLDRGNKVIRAAPELGAAKVSLSAFDDAASRAYQAERGFAVRTLDDAEATLAADGGRLESALTRGGVRPGQIGRAGEARVQAFLESKGSWVEEQIPFRTRLGGRIQDLRAEDGLLPGFHEVKTGETTLRMSPTLRAQIAKDQIIMARTGEQVYWHMLRPTSRGVLDSLSEAGIVAIPWV